MRRSSLLLTAGLTALLAASSVAAGARSPLARHAAAQPSPDEVAYARQGAAEEEASALLAGTPLPAGATAYPAEPPGLGGVLRSRPREAADLVERTGWWIVPGAPGAVIAYIHDHQAGVSSERFSVGAVDDGVFFATVQLAEMPGPIAARRLELQAFALPGGKTALRVDADVLWVGTRDPIPRNVRFIWITVNELRGPRQGTREFQITRPKRVAATVALADSLEPARPSFQIESCPAGFGSLTLAFYSSGAKVPLAVMTDYLGGCGGVTLLILGDRDQPGLREPSNGFVAALEHVTGRKHLTRFR